MAKKNRKSGLSRMFDGIDGQISTKKLFGAFIIIVVLTCAAYSVFRYGLTHEAVEILNTSMIVGATLLGLTSITSIWKNNSSFDVKTKNESDEDDDKPNKSNDEKPKFDE